MEQLMPLHPIISCSSKNPEWFTLLVPAYPGCPGKKAVKGCSSSSLEQFHVQLVLKNITF